MMAKGEEEEEEAVLWEWDLAGVRTWG